MTSAYLDAVAARAGEPCTVCPPWVIACAHLDGQVLALTERRLVSEKCCHAIAPPGFSVGIGGGWRRCPTCHLPGRPSCTFVRDFGTDLSAAQAEFARRDEELRQRVPA